MTERETAVREVARKALPGLLKAAAADMKSYGFAPGDDTARAELGAPFEVFALNSASVKSYKAPVAVTNFLVPADEWIFPVQCNGSNRVVLIVRQTDKGWKAMYFGNGHLARQLGQMRDQWVPDKDAQITLVSLTDIRSFWFSVRPHLVENLTPLSDLKLPSGEVVSAPQKPLTFTPAIEVLPKLAQALQEIERQENRSLLK